MTPTKICYKKFTEHLFVVVIMLYYVEGFKTREIAELLQINESTIRSRLVSARKQMAERIEYESI